MLIVQPKVECWENEGNIKHIVRCARVCYTSESEKGVMSLYNKLITSCHYSMLRHGSRYYKIPVGAARDFELSRSLGELKVNPFVTWITDGVYIYISTNEQFFRDNVYVYFDKLSPYEVDEVAFEGTPGDICIRKTYCVLTQISTSRELNRVSPNNIAEQSTRYVNFNKKGGVTFCAPHWYATAKPLVRFIARLGWRFSEKCYNRLLKSGLPPQDAREFLLLCAATKVVYTYSIREWKHILDLRYFGKTGKPHPNAKIVAKEIFEDLCSKGYHDYLMQ